MVGNVAVDLEGFVRRPRRQIARGLLPVVSWPSRLIRPLSGNVLAVEHIEAGALARAVRTDQRQDSRRHEAQNDTPRTAMDAAIGFTQILH